MTAPSVTTPRRMKHTVEEITLKNGAKGLFVHLPDAMVMDVYINFRAGEYLVERDKWETPHLMEHVLLGANDLYPRARDFQAEVEKTVPTVMRQPMYTTSCMKPSVQTSNGIVYLDSLSPPSSDHCFCRKNSMQSLAMSERSCRLGLTTISASSAQPVARRTVSLRNLTGLVSSSWTT